MTAHEPTQEKVKKMNFNWCCEYFARRNGGKPSDKANCSDALGLSGKFKRRRQEANRRKAVRALLRGAAVELDTVTNQYGQVTTSFEGKDLRVWSCSRSNDWKADRAELRKLQIQGIEKGETEKSIPSMPGLNIKVAGKIRGNLSRAGGGGFVIHRRAFLLADLQAVLNGEPIAEIPEYFSKGVHS